MVRKHRNPFVNNFTETTRFKTLILQNKNKVFHTASKDRRGHRGRRKDKLAALFSCCVGVLCVRVYRFVLPLKRCSTVHPFAFIRLSFHSIAAFLLADTLLTWSSLLLGGEPKWAVSVGVSVCVSREVQYNPPPLSVFITKPHCGGTAVRKGYSDYNTVQVLVLHTTKTVRSIDPTPCFPMI